HHHIAKYQTVVCYENESSLHKHSSLKVSCNMKVLACIVLALAACAFAEEAEKKTEKRGVVGLGYGGYGHGLGYGGYGHGLGYGGYGHGLGYAAAPAVAAAPVSHVSQVGYAAPAIGYGHGLGYAGHAIAKVGYAGLGYGV
ncbi:hypothetical protein L9F63_026284, partial [Diploptera punctata]